MSIFMAGFFAFWRGLQICTFGEFVVLIQAKWELNVMSAPFLFHQGGIGTNGTNKVFGALVI